LLDLAVAAAIFFHPYSDEIMLKRLPLVIVAVLCLSWCAAPANVAFADQSREDNIDRPGGDFRNFPVNPPGPDRSARSSTFAGSIANRTVVARHGRW
jgi:hypothetical protein